MGIMHYLRKKRSETKGIKCHMEYRESEFMDQLKKTLTEINKLFSYSMYSKYFEKMPDLSKASLQIDSLLSEKEEGD